jgi:predicted nuclease of predicted toxin-antitoxin system
MTVLLLLDEMFSPGIAAELRQLDHDVLAVADRPDLRSKPDEEIFSWATAQKRWLLTENVKDFRQILLRALQAGQPGAGVLFTSSRTFPRSRKNPGPLVRALDAWLTAGPPAPPVMEAWLAETTLPARLASGIQPSSAPPAGSSGCSSAGSKSSGHIDIPGASGLPS